MATDVNKLIEPQNINVVGDLKKKNKKNRYNFIYFTVLSILNMMAAAFAVSILYVDSLVFKIALSIAAILSILGTFIVIWKFLRR